MMPISEVYNEDNMIGMARYPDKFFDLAIVDPEYGIGEDGASNHSRNKAFGSKSFGKKNTRRTIIQAKKYTPKSWDKQPPPIEYFNELLRVSKKQIVWGANHFISRLPYDSSCWIVWDKDNSGDFADCELAWTSFKSAVRKFKWRWNGMLQEKMAEKEVRIHPTQKPVALYKWLLTHYAQPGNKILDTHMGSQSSRIAAYQMGFDYYGWEIDNEYFEAGNKRFKEQTAQLKLL
jgi:site-specific DNA-methyltransferase (adenine-specific)